MGNIVARRAASLASPKHTSKAQPGLSRESSQVSAGQGPRCFEAPQMEEARTVLTWNVAAVNNNPFEYWITYEDPLYNDLMQGVETFLEEPGEHDVEVQSVFTEEMFQELKALCEKEGMEGLDVLEETMWRGGELRLSHRRIVTEFIKDASLGSKRLMSMPDRMTNTINVVTRKESEYRPPPACRPCVINAYEGDLSTTEAWWDKWKGFMFHETMTVRTKSGVEVRRPVEMLEPILRSKYPAVTEEEERLVVPLQLLCLAIFDAVTVHFMNKLSPEGSWQVVKAVICDRLHRRKQALTMEILEQLYAAVDVMGLQEVAGIFKDTFARSKLAETHALVCPEALDGKRDQNSMLVLRKGAFETSGVAEVTSRIAGCMPADTKLADGDLLAVEATGAGDKRRYLLISFHGDTDGLLTLPLLQAVDAAFRQHFASHTVLVMMDANAYEANKNGRPLLLYHDLLRESTELGLATCWGESADVSLCRTTCSARTSLQPQLNKAVRAVDKISKAEKNPKDHILFYKSQAQVLDAAKTGRQPNPLKDNTGRLGYKEDSMFPTLTFPSDHGILVAAVRLVR